MRASRSASTRRSRYPSLKLVALGALAVALLLIVFFVSFHANNGLPWQSTYDFSAEVPNADRLVAGNDVRIAGVRVGEVSRVTGVPGRTGAAPYARVDVQLAASSGPIPTDTIVQVREASVLGASYLSLTPGDGGTMLPAHGTLPLQNARSTVQLTDLFDIFSKATSTSIRSTLGSLGSGFAGRGIDFNATLGGVNQLLPPLQSVAATLNEPATRLPSLVTWYAQFIGDLSAVSPQLTGLIVGGSVTFGALVKQPAALGAAIDDLGPAEDVTSRAFTDLQPSLSGLASIARELVPAAKVLPAALSQVDSELATGLPALRAVPPVAPRLQTTLSTLGQIVDVSSTDGTVRKLTQTVEAARPTMETLTQNVKYCDGAFAFLNGFSGALNGLWADAEGKGPPIADFAISHLGAQGAMFQVAKPSPDLGSNPYPYEDSHECEAGNEPFDGQQLLGNPPGNQPTTHLVSHTDPAVVALARRAGLWNTPAGTAK